MRINFVLLYYKLLRLHIQTLKGPVSKGALNFLVDAEKISISLAKITLADLTLLPVRPSILGAAVALFGLR